MRVGLVLGGGGVRGAAWLMGALHGLAAETGWDPASAELVIGTSAGAFVGALTAVGARPWEVLSPKRPGFFQAVLGAAAFQPDLSGASLLPGSLELVRSGWRLGLRGLTRVVAGLAPRGVLSTEPLASLVRKHAPNGWPLQPRLWLVATDYRPGARVVIGRPGEPTAALGLAVAASCAIPGLYRPVEIAGRLYIDGGVSSGANLDLAAVERLDLVICMNPLSSPPSAIRTPVWRIRTGLHRQLLPQMLAVARSGARLVLIEPAGTSIRLIGFNPMSRKRGREIGTTASVEVRSYLRRPEVRRKIAPLLPG
jgi:NTE family protein